MESKIDIDILQYADEGGDPLRYFLKFEMDALLRGSSKERADIHRIEIETGYRTRNEVRLDEDYEPLDGLDEPVLALNMGRGSAGGASASRGVDRRDQITTQVATHLVRKEIAAATKAAERHASSGAQWQAWLREFYGKHTKEVAERLCLPLPVAKEYASRQGLRLAERGVSVLVDWERTIVAELVQMALSTETIAAARAVEENAA
jgi:hypothetical protein